MKLQTSCFIFCLHAIAAGGRMRTNEHINERTNEPTNQPTSKHDGQQYFLAEIIKIASTIYKTVLAIALLARLEQQRFTISEVAADWHELMIHIMSYI